MMESFASIKTRMGNDVDELLKPLRIIMWLETQLTK